MRNARLEDLKFQWNRTKFYVKDKIYEIPDIIGYWSGKELVLDKLDPGEYRLKYFGDRLNEKYSVIFTVENNVTVIPLSVPEWATAIYVYKSNGLYVGKVRITQINSIEAEGVSKEFVENYAQPKGDYLTQDDKEAIIQEVIDTLGTPVFGTVDGENNIVLSGNLAEGTYNLKYENRDGTTNDIGSITIGGEKPAYTNWIKLATDTDGNIYNGMGYKENTRISSSSGSISAMEGVDLTGFIPVKDGDIVRLKNVTFVWSTIGSNGGLHFYKSDKTTKAVSVNAGNYQESSITSGLECEYDASGNLVKFTVKPYGGMVGGDAAYLRVCASDITVDSIITVNEEIV